ncbi:MAG: class I SAM-dependent methyltransferase [Terriglobales bacterium]|jgi:SAM-dependent methyltransferase
MPDSANSSTFDNLARWWRETRASHGRLSSLALLAALTREFLRDSLPSHRRQRYGDVDYDWDHRVDTTSATVNWRDRLLGLLNSPYQPTDPALFQEMLSSLNLDFRDFTFIDIGSGKGRTLLMASDYPFRRIVGVELLPELHRVAQDNIAKYKPDSQRCLVIESLCGDAREFVFPPEPTVLYLFNPLPEAGLIQLLTNLEQSLQEHPRPVFVIYPNPVLERVLAERTWLQKIGSTHQYGLYATLSPQGPPFPR